MTAEKTQCAPRSNDAREWISIVELAEREGLSVVTLRRIVRRRLITFRRRGVAANSPYEFPAEKAHLQLQKLREQEGIALEPDQAASPTMFQLVQEVRGLRVAMERLEARVDGALAKTPGIESERG